MMYICNVDEKSILKGNEFSNKVEIQAQQENADIVIVSAAVESQIAEFKKEESERKVKVDERSNISIRQN